MDPVLLSVVAAVAAGGLAFAVLVALWALRRTISLLKRLIVLAFALAVVGLLALGAAVALIALA